MYLYVACTRVSDVHARTSRPANAQYRSHHANLSRRFPRKPAEDAASAGSGARPDDAKLHQNPRGTGDCALGPLGTGCAGIAAGRPALSAAILTQLVADSRRRHAIAARARRTLYHAVHLHHNPPPGPTAQPGSWLTFPAAGCCGGLANLDKFHS